VSQGAVTLAKDGTAAGPGVRSAEGSVRGRRLAVKDTAVEETAVGDTVQAKGATEVGRAAGSATLDSMEQLEPYRTELTAYCYRMLGSPFEADDAVQEAMTRAWKAFDRFEGRSALRSWLYRIATNVCFDHLDGRRRRALPMDLGPANRFDQGLGAPMPEAAWVLPMPDGRVVPSGADPAEQAAVRDSVRLAFVAALQHLPPRQRAVLVLREVLRFEASEVARLLDTTVASVNSALQRARATLAAADIEPSTDVTALDDEHRALLDRYEDAFLRYDVEALVALLHEDATLTMPPFPFWLQGAEEAGRFWASPGPADCAGSRLAPVSVNGLPGFGQYKPSADGTRHEAWCLQVVELEGDRIRRIDYFLDTPAVFPLFGLPLVWPGD
jgi:RNA polymerase sigma-70 factor (ECF subfamily)